MLILIRGLQGSGKSTKALEYKALGFIHLEADMFFGDGTGNYTPEEFDPNLVPQAHRWCILQTIAYLKRGYEVVVANTFARFDEMQPYFDIADRVGIRVEVITCRGQYANVHGVPEDILQRTKARWQE